MEPKLPRSRRRSTVWTRLLGLGSAPKPVCPGPAPHSILLRYRGGTTRGRVTLPLLSGTCLHIFFKTLRHQKTPQISADTGARAADDTVARNGRDTPCAGDTELRVPCGAERRSVCPPSRLRRPQHGAVPPLSPCCASAPSQGSSRRTCDRGTAAFPGSLTSGRSGRHQLPPHQRGRRGWGSPPLCPRGAGHTAGSPGPAPEPAQRG